MILLSHMLASLKKLGLFQWLLIITVLYLLWQISLSGAILMADSEEASLRLSELAKKTVGFGTALFVFRAAVRRTGWLIALALAIPLGWGAMCAENAIVSHFADRTSGRERLEAKTVLLFNSALAKGGVKLPDLTPVIADSDVRLLAFSKVLGFAIWNNQALMDQIRGQTSGMLAALYGQEAYDRVDREYDRYVEISKEAVAKLEDARRMVRQTNFASLTTDLNRELAAYAGCRTDDCRQQRQDRVNRFVEHGFGKFGLKLNLEDFCQVDGGSARYVLGKKVESGGSRVCSASEKTLHDYVENQIDSRAKGALADYGEFPPEIAARLTSGSLVSLEEWRKLWVAQLHAETVAREKDEFSDAGRLGPDGAEAEKGRNYAISVFLPPVALGFSVTVCFLHLASLATAITRRPRICGAAAATIYILPAIFATATPLSGLAGIYAKWLVFWEGALYYLGILRWLIG